MLRGAIAEDIIRDWYVYSVEGSGGFLRRWFEFERVFVLFLEHFALASVEVENILGCAEFNSNFLGCGFNSPLFIGDQFNEFEASLC